MSGPQLLNERYISCRLNEIKAIVQLSESHTKVGIILIEDFASGDAMKMMSHMAKLDRAFGPIKDKVRTLWTGITAAKNDAKDVLAGKPSFIPGKTKAKFYGTAGKIADLQLKLTAMARVIPQIMQTIARLRDDGGPDSQVDLSQPLTSTLDNKEREQLRGMIVQALGGTSKIFGIELPFINKIPYIKSKEAVADEMLQLTGVEIEELAKSTQDLKMPVSQASLHDYAEEATQVVKTQDDILRRKDQKQSDNQSPASSADKDPTELDAAMLSGDAVAAFGREALGDPDETGKIPVKTSKMINAIRKSSGDELKKIQDLFLSGKLKFERRIRPRSHP